MAQTEDWWTAPAISEDGRDILVTGRRDVGAFRRNPKFHIRIEVRWVYDEAPDAGMPSDADAAIMGTATDNLLEIL
ncbi:MAG: DUF695 domain-containing protein, partial [Muribaculaceae bacterium]|nr:DUF695 domain-containing protein [Muribaculaceae bacterium]